MLGTFCRIAFAFACAFTVSYSASAQGSWADQLVDTRKLDFGVVATGAETVKQVTVKNTTNATVHISGVSTACLCAQASQPVSSLLQPGEETIIEVRLNTRQFSKKRDTSLTISFDAPQFASVQIPISAYIRTDVVFEPGIVQFGNVAVGAGAESNVSLSYAGRSDWKIVDVKIGSQDLTATLKETGRSAGRVDYQLTMKLSKDAKPQRVRDLVTLVTDDAANPYVPLMVEGVVVAEYSLAQDKYFVGNVRPGKEVPITVVVKGREAFHVQSIAGDTLTTAFNAKLDPTDKEQHVLMVKFLVPDTPGKFSETVTIEIAGKSSPVKFQVNGTVLGSNP
ncbi:MAG: DUF1573 domain-containing protein [Planctomyces sp.]|nr:DUF1573 domain-containing protein [Planctomyces sp.]